MNTPLTVSKIKKLRSGDIIYLSGTVFTMRDEAHKRISKLIKEGNNLPFNINGQIIYYTGPAPAPEGKAIGSAGPTSSYRMDPYTPELLKFGIKAMIGKGQRSAKIREMLIKEEAVYLMAVGGAAVLLSKSVLKSEIIAFEGLGHEAVRKLEVKDFPCLVAYDIYGNDIFKEGINRWKN